MLLRFVRRQVESKRNFEFVQAFLAAVLRYAADRMLNESSNGAERCAGTQSAPA